MTFSGERIREVKPLSFIYEVAHALPADVCQEAIRRISGREDWSDIDRTLSQQLVATFNEFALEFPFFAANASASWSRSGTSTMSPGRPAQGKLILFPPFWTHVHRGVELEQGVKYIATTWICFA